jgi:hypothetical protein
MFNCPGVVRVALDFTFVMSDGTSFLSDVSKDDEYVVVGSLTSLSDEVRFAVLIPFVTFIHLTSCGIQY